MTFPFLLRPVLILITIFYLNFLSRIVIAPLLPIIEIKFNLGHGEAGSLFLFIASGYCVGLFCSAFVSSRLNHRRTILLSATALGGAMLAVSRSASVSRLYGGLLIIGISAGFYLPSGVTLLTQLVNKEHWGKAMAFHQLAPNLALITAPLLVESLLELGDWRDIFCILGISSILSGVSFQLLTRGGGQKGEPPNPKVIQKVFGNPSFWILATVFSLSNGASLGVYSMLPLFLVNEKGMARELANIIIGFSRVSAAVFLLFSGSIIDRIGYKRAMVLFLAITGIFTLMLGVLNGRFITPTLIIFQATSAACFTPAGLAAVSLIFPLHLRSLAVSLLGLIAFFFGGGLMPSSIGYLADAFSFSLGFSFTGMLVLTILPLLFYVTLNSHFHEKNSYE